MVTSPPPMPATWPTDAPPAFHVMAKPSGAICNLDCTYCFFLSKELLYPGDRFRMADEMLEAYIRQTIESHRGPEVVLAFQGGEPTLMGVDFFERAVAYAQSCTRPNQTVQFTIQTNGVLLNERWAQFFRDNHFLVGLSVDGPADMHDAYRLDKQGRGTFDRVREAANLLRRYEVDVNVLCTVNAANADFPLEVYRFFRDELGIRFMQFIPIVERATAVTLSIANRGWGEGNTKRPLYRNEGTHVTERSVRPEQWGHFMSRIFDEWVRRDVGDVYVMQFEYALASWAGEEPALCLFKETCGTALALEHNGDLYSCDHYVDPEHKLGNIATSHMVDLVASPQQVAFGRAKKETLPPQCLRCDVRFACHGECPRNRFVRTKEGDEGLNYLCEGYYAFFHHIDREMKIMAQLLRSGRPVPDIAAIVRAHDEERFRGVGRNDVCPCGSGVKFKSCHGRPAT